MRIDKENVLETLGRGDGESVGQVVADLIESRPRDRHQALLVALAEDSDIALVKVDVRVTQAGQFRYT